MLPPFFNLFSKKNKITCFVVFFSCVYNFVFYLSDGTPDNHSLVCERFSHGRFLHFPRFFLIDKWIRSGVLTYTGL